MKEMQLGQKMRWVAGLTYGLLAVALMLAMRFFLVVENGSGMMLSNMAMGWVANLLLIVVAAAMSVWMFSGKEYLSEKARRAVVAATVLVLIYHMISYSSMAEAIRMTLTVTFGLPYQQSIWELVAMIVIWVLETLAAFFVASAGEHTGRIEYPEGEGEESVLETSGNFSPLAKEGEEQDSEADEPDKEEKDDSLAESEE